jgi:ribonuclease Z
VLFQILDDRTNCEIDAALKIHWVHAGGYALCAFLDDRVGPVRLTPGLLLDEEEFRVEGAVLDHGIPCLAFALEEKLRVNVWREGLRRLELPVGPWLREAKRAVRQGAPDHSQVSVHDGLAISLGDLRQHALRTARGQKIAYVVDLAYDERNIKNVVALARDADQLFIEAPFLDADANIAAETASNGSPSRRYC